MGDNQPTGMVSGPARESRTAPSRSLLLAILVLVRPACADDADPDLDVCADDPAATYTFARDPLTAAPFRWPPGTCVALAVADTAAKELDASALLGAVEAAASAWREVDCTSVCFELAGTAPASSFGYDPEASRPQTLLVWVSEEAAWRARHSESAIAITSVFTEPATGRILDADIELNDFSGHRWTLDGGADSADVRSVVAHELGHVLGLGHDADPSALLTGRWEPGWLVHGPTASDRAGLCALYECVERE